MAKGTYTVDENVGPSKDESFRSCICTMLVFLVLCVVLLLVALPWKNNNNKPTLKEKNAEKLSLVHHNNKKEIAEGDIETEQLRLVFTNPNTAESVTDSSTGTEQYQFTSTTDLQIKKPTITTESTSETKTISSTPATNTKSTNESSLPTETTISVNDDTTESTSETETTNSTPATNTKSTIESSLPTETTISVNDDTTESTSEIEPTNSTPATNTKSTNESSLPTETTISVNDDTTESTSETETTNSTPATNPKLTIESSLPTETTISVNDDTTSSTTGSTSETDTPMVDSLFKQQQQNVCQDSDCKTVAIRILSRINHMAEACEDFYNYACGSYDSDNEHNSNWRWIAEKVHEVTDTSPKNRQIFRNYFDSCVTFHRDFDYKQRLQGANNILREVSKLYQQSPETNKLTELLTQLLLRDSSPLFDISVDVDNESKHFIFKLTLGKQSTLLEQHEKAMSRSQQKCFQHVKRQFNQGTVVDLNAMYERFTHCKNNHSDYLNSVERAIKEFIAFGNLNENAIADILFTIERDILDLSPHSSVHDDIMAKKYKVSELRLHFKLINWNSLLTQLTGKAINDDDIVQVYFEDYFKKIFKHLESLPSKEVINAILAMFANDLYINLVVSQATKDIEDFCLRQSGRLLKEVTSSILLTRYSSTDLASAQIQLNQTFTELTGNMSVLVSEAEWLGNTSRELMIEKLHKMAVVNLDTLEIWRNEKFIDTRVTDLLNTDQDYQIFSIALLKHNRKTLYNLWGKDALLPEHIWWFYTTPFDSKAISVYSLNTIVVPPAVIPKNIPGYISLATFGYSLAQQIASQFDFTGIKDDTKISKDARISYDTMETCITNKYLEGFSQYVDGKLLSFKLNANLSTNERILEEMAVKLITMMSSEVINNTLLPWISAGYSREKIFYLAIAQEHCVKTSWEQYFIELFESDHLPPSFLLKELFGNLISFAETFECPKGSEMNHSVKCQARPDQSDEVDLEPN